MIHLDRAELDAIVADQARLVALANQLEYCLYAVGERPDDQPLTDCRLAASALIGALRDVLFRHDQKVLPALETLVRP